MYIKDVEYDILHKKLLDVMQNPSYANDYYMFDRAIHNPLSIFCINFNVEIHILNINHNFIKYQVLKKDIGYERIEIVSIRIQKLNEIFK